MPDRCVGMVVVGKSVTVVDAELPDDIDQPIQIIADATWSLQAGETAAAYDVMSRRCANYLRENGIQRAFIKASATTRGSATIALLQSAELRGVVIAAAASTALVKTLPKSHVSRNYGDRNVDEYIEDDLFWAAKTTGGKLRKASREAAMYIIAGRSQ
jgi:hypothetical protein